MAAPMRTGMAAAVLALALVAAGCGGDDGQEPAVSITPTTSPPVAAETGTGATSGDASEPGTPASEPGSTEGEATTEPGEMTDGTYTVASGDTLTSIASRFDTTVDALVEANDIDDPNVIAVGDELTIPPSS